MTLQEIADQIAADPTLRVVFVAASHLSADAFVHKLRAMLPADKQIARLATTRRICVEGWDGRGATVLSIREGAPLLGCRVDLMVYEVSGTTHNSADRPYSYLCRLTQRGRETFFNWDHEPRI